MCGATRPTKPIVPTNDTASAASALTRSRLTRRRRLTSMPKLAARSSPRRTAVSFQASRSENGSASASAAAITPTVVQVARARLPMVQNTMPCSASSLAMNCSSMTSAWNEYTSAMPNSTTPSVEPPRQRATRSRIRTDTRVLAKADNDTTMPGGSAGTCQSSVMASEAPNAAAADTPSV